MVLFWIPILIRHQIFLVPKKGTTILTTTHLDNNFSVGSGFRAADGLGSYKIPANTNQHLQMV